MEIGMALGSPSHQPVAWNSHYNYDTSRQTDSPESLDQMDDWKQAALPQRPKASKWKTFGGLFGGGRKTKEPVPAFYQVQLYGDEAQPEKSDTVEQNYTTFPSPQSFGERPRTRGEDKRPMRGRTNTLSEKKTKQHKPDLKRSQTAPLDFDLPNHNEPPKQFPLSKQTPEIQLDGGPMLNVDIPSIELERYSVMFGSLLKPTHTTSSNLLARRQATLDKLKMVNEAIAEHVSQPFKDIWELKLYCRQCTYFQ